MNFGFNFPIFDYLRALCYILLSFIIILLFIIIVKLLLNKCINVLSKIFCIMHCIMCVSWGIAYKHLPESILGIVPVIIFVFLYKTYNKLQNILLENQIK